jgi:hypothetical protein
VGNTDDDIAQTRELVIAALDELMRPGHTAHERNRLQRIARDALDMLAARLELRERRQGPAPAPPRAVAEGAIDPRAERG